MSSDLYHTGMVQRSRYLPEFAALRSYDDTQHWFYPPIAPAMPAADEPFDPQLCFPQAADCVRTAEVCQNSR